MSDVDVAVAERQFHFVRHGEAGSSALDWKRGPEIVRKAIGESLNGRP